MKKTRTPLTILTALVLSIVPAATLFVGHAFAVTRTWNGNSGDHKLSTAGNWAGGQAPGPSDDLVFPYGANADKSPVDDLGINFSIGNIKFNGTPSGGETDYDITGNSIDLGGGITITSPAGSVSPTIENAISIGSDQAVNDGGNNLTLSGVLSNGANLDKNGTGTLVLSGNNTFFGFLTANAGSLKAIGSTALGTNAHPVTINDGADLSITSCAASLTVTKPIDLTGVSSNTNGSFPTPKLYTATNACSSSGNFTETYGSKSNSSSVTLSGDISLNSGITFGSYSPTTLSGNLSGSFAISTIPGYSANLIVNGSSNSTNTANGTYSPAVLTKTISDSQAANSVGIFGGNTIVTITGTRGAITLDGGTLKGTGTIGALSFVSGIVAPGMSPGVLNAGNLNFTGGTYQVEIGGTATGSFDQLNVTGTINLGSNTTLDTSLYNGFKPSTGSKFTIINNDGGDAVTGTFKGLAEGANFTSGGYTFQITYKGGTGNDVVLTVVGTAPGAPDTGFSLITINPLMTLILLCVATPVFALAARRFYLGSKR